jgi:phosphoglycerate dehydrogenase-like enzyme
VPPRKVLFTFQASPEFLKSVSEGFEESYEFLVARSRQDALKLVPEAEVLIMNSPIAEVIEQAKSCKWIHVVGAGVDGYLALEMVSNNPSMALTNSSGLFGTQASEHVFALLLGVTRSMSKAVLAQREGEWLEEKDYHTSETEINGKQLTIVGLGDVGLNVARRAKSFGLTVTGVKRSSGALENLAYSQYFDRIVTADELDHALMTADIVVDCLPLTPETKNIFNRDRFSVMKEGVIFVNIGRGQTIDEQALTDALSAGRVGYAGLDVFTAEPLRQDSPLWKADNVIITPHRAGRSQLLYSRAVPLLRENLKKYLNGDNLTNLVDKSQGY